MAAIVLDKLIGGLPIRRGAGAGNISIEQLTDDSRDVKAGALFIARRGSVADGAKYAADAVKAGAAAVLSEAAMELPGNVAQLLTDDVRAMTGILAERFYGNPAKKLTLIGVTGTNGKTTTAYLVRHLLNAAGRRCGLISTVEVDDGATVEAAHLTTPGAIELSETLARMVGNGCDSCVMEVSSHALDQGRADALEFAAGIFTNLTGDHLDYHRTMEEYASAKAKLFERLGAGATAVVNADDPASARMTQHTSGRIVGYGIDHAGDYLAWIKQADAEGSTLALRTPSREYRVHLPLVGKHNVANLLGAAAAVESVGVHIGGLIAAIESVKPVPGRLERVSVKGVDLPVSVLVDYAHTDDALRNVLAALRPITRGRLRVMFGCGGDRDRTKRPRMAAVACELADDVVITSDNPRNEPPEGIIEEILSGVPKAWRGDVVVEADRHAAIRRIIGDAVASSEGDVVLLAGKGHEDYQIVGTQRRAFDDRKEAAKALAESAAKVVRKP